MWLPCGRGMECGCPMAGEWNVVAQVAGDLKTITYTIHLSKDRCATSIKEECKRGGENIWQKFTGNLI